MRSESFLLNGLSGSGPIMVLGTVPERSVHLKADPGCPLAVHCLEEICGYVLVVKNTAVSEQNRLIFCFYLSMSPTSYSGTNEWLFVFILKWASLNHSSKMSGQKQLTLPSESLLYN